MASLEIPSPAGHVREYFRLFGQVAPHDRQKTSSKPPREVPPEHRRVPYRRLVCLYRNILDQDSRKLERLGRHCDGTLTHQYRGCLVPSSDTR